MRPPCEYVVKTYIPQVRARIIRNLIEKHGWKPIEVARALEITITSVLKYKKIILDGTDISEDYLEKVAEEATNLITSEGVTPESFIEFICKNCMVQRIEGEICKIHRMNLPKLERCQVCSHVYHYLSGITDVRRNVISNILAAYNLLQSIDNFDKMIPEVRTNIVMAIDEAKDVSDIAGFPGRLTTVKGKIFAQTRPEFNASKHLATILLAAKNKNKKISGLICIKFDENIKRSIEENNLKFVIMDRDKYRKLEEFIKKLDDIPDIIIDPGTLGVEPITYVFGETALDAAKKVLKIYNNLR